MKLVILGLLFFCNSLLVFSNSDDSLLFYNWHNLSIEDDTVPGVSTEKAYNELLKDKIQKKVVVAVIDGGVDINHEDLKGRIWINRKEIPGNGLDDDNNGYIDDVYGWNFLGNSKGENINEEALEVTRLYGMFKKEFEPYGKKIPRERKKEYKEFLKIKKAYDKGLEEVYNEYNSVKNIIKKYYWSDSLLKSYFKKDSLTINDLQNLGKTRDKKILQAKDLLMTFLLFDFKPENLNNHLNYLEKRINYHYNPDFNPRPLIGDNPYDIKDSIYGNNDVVGPSAEHGTAVAGVIAAIRDNDIGIKGMVDSVEIMVIRAIPDGDERDKDVALAIRYAVKNGAKVINMSFGKEFSPQKEFVDEALKYAEANDVLVIHAAGNEGTNTDKKPRYPYNYDNKKNRLINTFINVGASTKYLNLSLPAYFSNYGKNSVDVFAPGQEIYTCVPDNKYKSMSGTSLAAPVVTGAAALLRALYPDLTANQIREILLESVTYLGENKVFLPDDKNKKAKKVKFKTLCSSGGIINVYNAIKLCESKYNQKIDN